MTPEQLKKAYGLSKGDMEKVILICQLMPTDPDGCWSCLQDEGIDIEFDDLNLICKSYL